MSTIEAPGAGRLLTRLVRHDRRMMPPRLRPIIASARKLRMSVLHLICSNAGSRNKWRKMPPAGKFQKSVGRCSCTSISLLRMHLRCARTANRCNAGESRTFSWSGPVHRPSHLLACNAFFGFAIAGHAPPSFPIAGANRREVSSVLQDRFGRGGLPSGKST